MKKVTHTFEPVYDEKNSRILILGTFPSVKSREQQFLLRPSAEPLLENFWQLSPAGKVPKTISEKKRAAPSEWHCIWDVVASCEIVGSSGSSIRKRGASGSEQNPPGGTRPENYANGEKPLSFTRNMLFR